MDTMGFVFGISGLSFGTLGFIFGMSASNSAAEAASKVNNLEQRLSDAGILGREEPAD